MRRWQWNEHHSHSAATHDESPCSSLSMAALLPSTPPWHHCRSLDFAHNSRILRASPRQVKQVAVRTGLDLLQVGGGSTCLCLCATCDGRCTVTLARHCAHDPCACLEAACSSCCAACISVLRRAPPMCCAALLPCAALRSSHVLRCAPLMCCAALLPCAAHAPYSAAGAPSTSTSTQQQAHLAPAPVDISTAKLCKISA
jgi:hypothetical protein